MFEAVSFFSSTTISPYFTSSSYVPYIRITLMKILKPHYYSEFLTKNTLTLTPILSCTPH